MLRALAVTALAVLAGAGPASADGGWVWPVEGRVVTPFDFHASSPYEGGRHRGIDIQARPGSPVVAAAPGTVAFAGRLGNSGLTISIEHAGDALRTSYLHLSGVSVAQGQQVGRGQAIGTSGTPSGRLPHLHFGVRAAGRPTGYLDPLQFLPEPVEKGQPPPVGPGGLRRPPDIRPFAVPRRAPVRPAGASDPGLVVAGMALAALAACLGASAPRRAVSSIARRWVTTSQRRSTT